MSRSKCRAWLPFLKEDIPPELSRPVEVAAFELAQAGVQARVCVDASLDDGWRIARDGDGYSIVGGECGVLYGAYHLLMALQTGEEPKASSAPAYALRMLNGWDNADGSVERGYAGRSLFFEGGRLHYDPERMRQLGRMLASVGLNVLCINNVNVRFPADQLIDTWRDELAQLAAIFRPFGVRLMVSIDYAMPMRYGVPTADPLDERVQQWWMAQADKVYQAVPDLAGFLVKADSEGRPGPFTYGRNHAEGANMLAQALKPHGGVLVWRCFVYNCQQDWRDLSTDRPKAAYEHYAYLDGQFADNVILQIKNGPFDFQVREPVSPLLYAMPKTCKAIEFQLAQEYTGQQIDIYAMAPMWREVFDALPQGNVQAIAAVTNLGRDDNYTGHPFAAVNLFGYGLLAWDPSVDAAQVIRRWAKLTYGLPQTQEDALTALLLNSRSVYEKYTAPLGLGWMVYPHHHYGPNPGGYEYTPWGTYHKADRNAVGIDRTAAGTGYLLQYPEELQAPYATPEGCPDELLLFYHRLPYDYVMADGRTLVQRIYDDHFEGLAQAQQMAQTLETLDLPEPDRSVAAERMQRQLYNAREWCDIVNSFFYRLSGMEDQQGRKLYL